MGATTTIAKTKTKRDDDIIATIQKELGVASIVRMGEASIDATVKVVSTGSLGVDRAIGVGGLPRGRIVEIFGPEAGGKTTLCLQTIANAQRQGLQAAFIDSEHALDINYARNLGVDIDALLVSQPDNGEQAIEIMQMLAKSGQVGMIAVDSVAALTPKAEIEGEAGDSHVGLHARLMSQAMRRLVAVTNQSDTLVVFTNQLRMKIGVSWGSPETTTGGNALKFYASVRLDVRRIGAVKQGDKVVGNRTRVKVAKNRMGAPFKVAEYDLEYGRGVSREGEVIELGVAAGILQKNGAWFSWKDVRLGQGLEQTKAMLRENPAMLEEIAALVMAAEFIDAPAKSEAEAGEFR